MNTDPIDRALDILGSQAALARVCDMKPPSMNEKLANGRPFSPEQCVAIEKSTDGAVPCEELRKDLQWVRIKDKTWPNPKGRPLVDHTVKVGADDTAKPKTADEEHVANVRAATRPAKYLDLNQAAKQKRVA